MLDLQRRSSRRAACVQVVKLSVLPSSGSSYARRRYGPYLKLRMETCVTAVCAMAAIRLRPRRQHSACPTRQASAFYPAPLPANTLAG